MATHRILLSGAVPVYLPAYYPDNLNPSFNFIANSLIPPLFSGKSYSCTELLDQSYEVQEVIWATLLSFIAYRRKNQGNGAQGGASTNQPRFRLIYLCSGFNVLRRHCKLLKRLRERMQAPDFDAIKVTAFSEPVNMCINRHILGKHKNSDVEQNTACRASVRCGRCPHYNNVYSATTSTNPDIPDFIPDLEDFALKLEATDNCPYYSALARMDSAQLVLTTFEALKGTLNGQRLPRERLLLDSDTYLVCDDAFAMEEMLEECYDCTLSVPALQRTISLCLERKRHLWVMQQQILPKPLLCKESFYTQLLGFCEALDKFCRILRGGENLESETSDGRMKMLADLGLQKMDPKSLHSILTLLQTDIFDVVRLQSQHRKAAIPDLANIHQFFSNLWNPVVADLVLARQNGQTFRFWLDRPEDTLDEQVDLGKLNFKFFGVSVNAGLVALKRMGLESILCFGPMVPVAFVSVDSSLAFRTRPIPYNERLQSKLGQQHLFSATFSVGPADVSFNCDLKQREDPRYVLALGYAIRRLLTVIPGKILFLFASVSHYEHCAALWQSDLVLRDLSHALSVNLSCSAAVCSACSGQAELHQRFGRYSVAFARNVALDGASAGYQAVIAVTLPYRFLMDPKVGAKKEFLKPHPTAAFDFYTQEAVNALVRPLINATSLDSMSVHRGRIFIVMDSRVHKATRFFPIALQNRYKEYSTFEEGVRQLKSFLDGIPAWDVGNGELIDPEVRLHIRHLHKSLLTDACEGNRVQLISKITDSIEQFRMGQNVDLFAANLVEALQVKRQFQSIDFHAYVLPWLMNFRQYFLRSDLQAYWLVVIQNLLKQIAENVKVSRTKRPADLTLPSGNRAPFKRCDVQ